MYQNGNLTTQSYIRKLNSSHHSVNTFFIWVMPPPPFRDVNLYLFIRNDLLLNQYNLDSDPYFSILRLFRSQRHRWCNGQRAVNHGFEHRSGQTKDYKIGNCCFSAKHAALRRKSKDWLARNQNNVSEWSDMSIHRLLFQ